jgi:hypothetical protein
MARSRAFGPAANTAERRTWQPRRPPPPIQIILHALVAWVREIRPRTRRLCLGDESLGVGSCPYQVKGSGPFVPQLLLHPAVPTHPNVPAVPHALPKVPTDPKVPKVEMA